jgi:DNA polymerase-1
MADFKWTLVDTLDKIPNLSSEQSLVVDVETTSFDDEVPAFNPFHGHRIAGFGISTVTDHNSWYFPLRHRPAEDNLPLENGLKALRKILNEREDRNLIGHNIKFDLRFMSFDDLVPKLGSFVDTITLTRLCRNYLKFMGLDFLAKTVLSGIDIPTLGKTDREVKEWCREHNTKDYGRVPSKILGEYCAYDCFLTGVLANKLAEELPPESREVWNTEKKLTRILFESECHGVLLDRDGLKREHMTNLLTMVKETVEVKKFCGKELNLGSGKDVSWLLFDKCGVKPIRFTDGGDPSLDAATLMTYAGTHPIAKSVVSYREASHFIGNYCEGWVDRADANGVLHGTFNQSGTFTGRMSSSDPNMQNIQKEAKKYIVPRPGYVFLSSDFAQIEYRIFGHYTKDPVILRAYERDPDTDFHQQCADLIGVPDRQFAKSLNFAFIYGMGKKKLLQLIAGLVAVSKNDDVLQRIFNLKSMDEANSAGGAEQISSYTLEAAKDLLQNTSVDEASSKAAEILYNKYHETFPSINSFTKQVWNVVKTRGWIRNLYGRVYRVSDAPHKSVNYLVQGSAADMFKRVLVELHEQGIMAKHGMKLSLNVHDEAVIETPEEMIGPASLDAQKILQDPKIPMRIPILADIGVCALRWYDKVETSYRVQKDYDLPSTVEGVVEAVKRSRDKTVLERAGKSWNKKNYTKEGLYVEPKN